MKNLIKSLVLVCSILVGTSASLFGQNLQEAGDPPVIFERLDPIIKAPFNIERAVLEFIQTNETASGLNLEFTGMVLVKTSDVVKNGSDTIRFHAICRSNLTNQTFYVPVTAAGEVLVN